jgi:hypothetical protein
MKKVLSTSELFEKLATEHQKENISLGEIKSALHERGFGILFIIFCLPLLIPLPVPTGMGTALSVPIFFFSYQLLVNKDSPWLPSWVLSKTFGIESFRKIINKSLKPLRFVEKFLKKRALWVSDTRGFEVFIALFILLLNIPICLPFPMSNVIPAASIIVIAFGMLEKDGVMILIGIGVGIIAWIVCIAIGFALWYGAAEVMQFVPESLRDEVKQLKETYLPNIEEQAKDNDSFYKILINSEDDTGIQE